MTRKKTAGMIFRYIISGFTGIGANLAVFSVIHTYTSASLWATAVCGFMAAYAVTFILHKYWTFKNLSKDLFYKQSVVYFFSAIVTLVINTSVLYLLVGLVRLEPVFSQFLSLLFGATLSFVFTSQVTFHINEDRIHAVIGIYQAIPYKQMWRYRKYVAFLVLVMTALVAVRLSYFPLTFTSDAVSYVGTAQLLLGNHHVPVYGQRILKPLAPGVTALVSQFGIPINTALLMQAVIGFFFLGFAAFWFGWQLFKKPVHALVLALVIVTSYPIFRYGLNYYTETGIWALYFAALAGTLRWIEKPTFLRLVVVSFLLLAGLLWKEYAVLAGVVFGFAILTQKEYSWRRKVHAIIQTAFLVLIPWFVWQYAVSLNYHYTYLDWLAVGDSSKAYKSEYTGANFLKTSIALLFGVWFFVIYGIYKWNTIHPRIKKMMLLMSLPSFGFLLWGYVSSRLFFSIVPLVAPLAVVGFMSLPNRYWKFVSVAGLIVVNSILVILSFDPHIRTILNHLS